MMYEDNDDVKPTAVTDRAWDTLSEHVLTAPEFFARIMGVPRRGEDGQIIRPERPRPVDISRLFSFAEEAARDLGVVESERYGPFAQMLLQTDELQAIEELLDSSCRSMEALIELSHTNEVQTAARKRWTVYNSLRTAFAEARYGLEAQDDAGSGVRPVDGDEGRPDNG